MRSRVGMLSLLAMLLVACSAAGDQSTTTASPEGPSTSLANSTTSIPPVSTTDSGTSTTQSGRPTAPDFTLQLGDGGSYTLSEGARPVYLVFWAEW